MSDTSPVLGLPLIQPAQAQKHVTHNEALRVLDVLVQAAVATRGLNVPPAVPVAGERHIVGLAPTGLWAGQPGRIAVWEATGWYFLTPQEGWAAHVVAEDAAVAFVDGVWVGPAERALRVLRLGVGTDADVTNRLAVVSPATLLNHAGAGHQVKVNKATAGDTASLLFQTGFSGRAEMGTTGSDNFTVKVSADGSLFRDGLVVAGATGVVGLPSGALLPDGAAGTPALAFSGDGDTGVFRVGADQMGFATNGVQRLALSTTALTSAVPVLAPAGGAAVPSLGFAGDADTGLFSATADAIGLSFGGVERARWTTTGLRVGPAGTNPGVALDFRGANATESTVNLHRSSDDSGGGTVRLRKSRGTVAAPTVPLANDILGTSAFSGIETGTTYVDAATIVAVAEADFASGSTPARMSMRTAGAGSTTLNERMRIDANGVQVFGRLTVNSAVAYATSVTIADDAVATVTPGRTGGFLMMTSGGGVGTTVTNESASAQIFFDCGSSSPAISKGTGFASIGSLVDVVTTDLTGTSGTDGRVTVSARNNGTLKIENRLGASTTFNLWVQ